MFKLENVSYLDILTSVNIEFGEGKISCVTGESGAGKSTILKFLNKMLIPTEGIILYRGKPLDTINSIDLRREAVMLPQDPVIFEGTVEDNLQIGLKFSRKDSAPRHILEGALKTVSLEKPLNERADKLSGGEKQRLALARILIMKPEVFLLDEPTSALDEKTEMEVMEGFLKEIRKNEGTVIMVTHSQSVAEKFADDNIIIEAKG